MEDAKIADLILDELISTTHPSLSISRILKKNNIDVSEDRAASVEHVLKGKSLMEERGKDSHGEAAYALTETGQDFIRSFGSYSKYLERVEKENRRLDRTRNNAKHESSINADGRRDTADSASGETFGIRKEDAVAVDLVLNELVSTMQPSISVRRVLKKNGVAFTDDLIVSIENILKGKSLVDEMGKDSRGYGAFTLAETGQDFIRTFGSYSKFLKGIEKENKRIERARNKKPYKADSRTDGDPVAAYVPPEQDARYVTVRLVFLFLIIVLSILIYKLT